MAMTGYVQVNPNSFVMLIDVNNSAYVSLSPSDDNGDWSMNPPIGTYTIWSGPTNQGPWTQVPNSGNVVIANATDASGDLTPAGTVYPGSGNGAQMVTGILAGNGVPSNAIGQNGWFYLRGDGGVGSNVYKKTGGAWGAIL